MKFWEHNFYPILISIVVEHIVNVLNRFLGPQKFQEPIKILFNFTFGLYAIFHCP